MNNVAYSNGANSLVPQFPTFGDIPMFPFIGGMFNIVWYSPNCGSCWKCLIAEGFVMQGGEGMSSIDIRYRVLVY